MNKSLSLGHRIRYPITITKILKHKGDEVKKQEPLMRYSFKWMKKVGDAIRENEWEEEQTTIADWDSPTEGELKEWRIKEGDVILKDQVCIVVREACGHEIQFQGLCAICGRDMTEVNWAAESRDTERAPINMTHDQTSLTVSELQATRAEHELQRRLLRQRKLSLVVDLDQTIIHACIEPTIGEWQRDPTNPNYEAVKDVRSFQLNDDGPRGLATGCSYYIKLRPGLLDFLTKISEMYELHVYTMGTRAYAKNIAALVDPDTKLFGNRVISRDENGNMTAKSLQRIFPVNTNMVVII
jgi:RNA polymerase II subunit A C-terminal domain phosphatase